VRLRAQPWVERADVELRACGFGSRGSGGLAGFDLTAQEEQVAMLAAGGLTNRQIGDRLGISPRTVAIHLYRTFPKLGVTTRAALRDALDRRADEPPPHADAAWERSRGGRSAHRRKTQSLDVRATDRDPLG
jgi:DNA-binding CsgD family transcriptional regulator